MTQPQLRRYLVHDSFMHIGQTQFAAAESEGQMFVIDDEQVQDRGLNIVDVHFVLNGTHTHLIYGSERRATANAASCYPDRIAAHMMIAAIALVRI